MDSSLSSSYFSFSSAPPPPPPPQIYDVPLPFPASQIYDVPLPPLPPQIYDVPLPFPAPQIYDVPAPLPPPQTYDVPLPFPAPQIYDVPAPLPPPQIYDVPLPFPVPQIYVVPPPPRPPQIYDVPRLVPAPQNYDVFLSFRGEDTRYNFISHLHKALDKRGINTFIDYNLDRGDEISPALLTAIEESRIAVIIFSKNYASSQWCLEELAQILECKNRETNNQIVIPVFYGVTPSDLRNQNGSFADAFAKHEKRFVQNLEQVHRWKDALKEVANLSGWPLSGEKSEAKLIEVIVEDVWQKLYYSSSSDTSNLVGIDSKIKKIESLLCMGTNDVRGVGIWGIGGIGKTTLAEAVFNKISCRFKGYSYFARNVRERCEQSDGLNRLKKELLLALLGDQHANINVYVVGRTFIKNMFRHKKLLIAFDDVSDFRQIEGLIGGFDCLGPQSRIIITTRDKQVLKNCEVQVYKVQELINHEALELFRMYAFRRNHPTEDYMKLSERVVKYAEGIPLALKVLGSHLYEKEIKVWESAIEKMEIVPHTVIYKVLKISYDGLDNEEQRIFLNIACFFKRSSIERVKSTLKACGFAIEVGIEVLLDKSLIAISHDGMITMHDLLEVMAKEIVRQESIEDPGKRSRLWDHEEIYNVLTKNTCTATIEGIALDMSRISDDILLNPCDFEEMHRLRFLKFYNSSFIEMNRVHVSQGLKYNFAALRYLCWYKCPIKSPFSGFSLENLVILDMRRSKVEQLWNGVLPLPKLKEVNLSESCLTSCPDFSGSPNLKELDLSWCEYLCEISPSVGCLSELDCLYLCGCSNLKTIPDFNGLISLRDLDLCGCLNLEMSHEMSCNLETFCLSFGFTEAHPLSFLDITKLQTLILDDCGKLKRLPSRICKLKSLQALYLDGCSELDQLPKDIGCLSSLKILFAEQTAIRELPSSIIYLKKCKLLRFSGLEIHDRLQILNFENGWLDPSDGDDMTDDEAIVDFSTITNLRFDLSNCMMVKCLPKLQLGGRRAGNLTALEVLSSLCFQDCRPLSDFEDIVKNALHALQIINQASVLLFVAGREVPEWFNFQSLGYFINLELSPNLLNQSFIGFALCVAMAPCQNYHNACYGKIEWTCKVKSKNGQLFLDNGYPEGEENYLFVKFSTGYEWFFDNGSFDNRPNQLFVKYPFHPFSPHILHDAKEISFEFNIINCDNQCSKIVKCGVHLMYAQYIEEVGGSSQVGDDENTFSSANVHHNYKEVDEPHPKRLKKTLY